MPEIYTPIFIYPQENISEHELKQIAKDSIGRLPKTKLKIPIKDFNAIVTHNTAILGILGIGKSCLTYELIKKLSNENIKIVCIDITNEYIKELPEYIDAGIIKSDDENAFNQINNKYEYIHREGNTANYEKSGNKDDYIKEIHLDLCKFLFNENAVPNTKEIDPSLKVRIYNPDYHKVSKGEKIGIGVITNDLTLAEKTRIIVSEIFKILMKLGVSTDKKARILVVFEEAHSLIPEWNSVSSEGDKTATNGTAKIILQGRKYGLGCFVITQRTANVSKSILNQCNTIFAMRVFDDTGKGFLENYFGTDYTNTLPTLEERNAIVIGKGLKLKQPVILELNNCNYLLTPHNGDTP
jgi:DNA helicase HerA-like ATPase